MVLAWVVVLGDFGRSPRMQYHTLSLSQQPSTSVYVLAYKGSRPIEQLCTAPNVHLITISEPFPWLKHLPRVLALVLKVIQQLLQLLWLMLIYLPRPNCILLQNPPAIPTLFMCWLAARRHRARLVVDWHNYGYTIMGLTHGKGRWLTRLAEGHEKFWGRKGDAHFCVTAAMKEDLKINWGIPNAAVLHDRPPSWFNRTNLPTTHNLFHRLDSSLTDPAFKDFLSTWQACRGPLPPPPTPFPSPSTSASGSPSPLPSPPAPVQTIMSVGSASGQVGYRSSRPVVVVSSTSWTPDEDFGVLLEAAQRYDKAAERNQAQLPQILFIITGKGPQKEMYISQLRQIKFSCVAFRTLWLEASDYPLLLGAADLGVCLHASSSGLDLPMKVVDMFGSGLPVCALSYSCIHELVDDGKTGLLFSNAEELSQHLQHLLTGFQQRPGPLFQRLQQGVAETQQTLRWDANWNQVAWPVLNN